ncbi:cholinesterase [Nannizzia gypsea CBS 118893]|uniref:Carboxylic ester hydrolase n=1 Tax=Arthroderma gypseum (strain ATCC MYA-4604 / CBS 118893) TaxID=535722 RepID=E4UXG3_ARTGP|nr:cholinesterase [Nannizzia gypsea CBS 118893]EFR01911.1 cholinesterase [Nannizzia gypsea CBS 118893]
MPPRTSGPHGPGSPDSSIYSPSPTPSTNLIPLKAIPKGQAEPTQQQRPLKSRKKLIILAVSIMTVLLTTLVVSLALVLRHRGSSAHHMPNGPLVELGYAKYLGTPGGYNVTSWLGIRYAAPPVGDLRFAAPQDPKKEGGIQRANSRGPHCISTNSKSVTRISEDCLRLNVFAPSNAGPNSKLPVFFFILGGGFNINSDPFLNGTGLIAASGHNMIVVTFTYRVSLYGFLPGKEIEESASLNNGLKDQIKALQWVKKYISKFGGNPDHVVIGGHSAGAASVAHLLTAHGGRNDNLFHGAIAGSPSFGTTLANNQSQYLYDSLVKRTGCDTQKDSLACLRKLDVNKLQEFNLGVPLPDSSGPPLFAYSPVIDGDLIEDSFYNLFNQGKYIDVPTVMGSDSNEGTIFAPHNTSTLEESDRWLARQFPALKTNHFEKLHELYPKPQVQYQGAGMYWSQLSQLYGEMRYVCPAMAICRTMSDSLEINKWSYEYHAQDHRFTKNGYGATHTVELNAIFGPAFLGRKPAPSYNTPENGLIVPIVQGYWTSFIRTLDPNKHRVAGSPEWKPSVQGQDLSKPLHRLFFETNGTKMISEDEGLKKRCDYLTSIGPALKQ